MMQLEPTEITTAKLLDPVNEFALAIKKLANENSQPSPFPTKNTLTFNGKKAKNENFEYFEDLFHTTLRMQPNLTEEMKTNHFHAYLRGWALKTFKNIRKNSENSDYNFGRSPKSLSQKICETGI